MQELRVSSESRNVNRIRVVLGAWGWTPLLTACTSLYQARWQQPGRVVRSPQGLIVMLAVNRR